MNENDKKIWNMAIRSAAKNAKVKEKVVVQYAHLSGIEKVTEYVVDKKSILNLVKK